MTVMPRRPTYRFGDRSFDLDALHAVCAARAAELRAQAGSRVLIRTTDSLQVLVGVYAALLAGKVAVLDPKRQADAAVATDGNAYVPWDCRPVAVAEPQTAEGAWPTTGRIVFFTSGSTGAPQAVTWELADLRREAAALRLLYALPEGALIAGLVTPVHIYGLLHLLLLPLLSDSDCLFLDPTSLALLAGLPQRIDLLVTVPALWQLTSRILDLTDVHQLVSSAGAFGEERAALLRQHPRRPGRAVEIFGSTETGGIGHRLLVPYAEAFHLFSGVRLESGPSSTVVHTPYRAGSVAIADRLEAGAGGTFRHLGRSDRIIKFAGQRVSLTEIEAALCRSLAVSHVVCAFEENPQRAQGGDLIAFVETESVLTLQAARAGMNDFPGLPSPNQLVCLPRFPRDATGKLQMAELIRSR